METAHFSNNGHRIQFFPNKKRSGREMGADEVVPIRLQMGSHVHPFIQEWQEEEIGSKSLPPYTTQTRHVFQASR
jgi:hypothetical protein